MQSVCQELRADVQKAQEESHHASKEAEAAHKERQELAHRLESSEARSLKCGMKEAQDRLEIQKLKSELREAREHVPAGEDNSGNSESTAAAAAASASHN